MPDARTRAAREREVQVAAGRVVLTGNLALPDDPIGMVLFAHGSGSSRHSPRNRSVARALNEAGLGTLLIDLLTSSEERRDAVDASLRFDIPFLAERLTSAIDWLAGEAETERLKLGLFGASTGAAAALMTAAERPAVVHAVVSRGGRPDLADEALPRVRAPTLLIVGSRDVPVIGMNREAQARMRAETKIEIVGGATHLFEEPGTLDEVADLAADWFRRHLQ